MSAAQSDTAVVQRRGYAVPVHCQNYSEAMIRLEAQKAARYTQIPKQRRGAVQAGGAIGIYPRAFAQAFECVLTFEPDPINWACLLTNIREVSNIAAVNQALGAEPGECQMRHVWSNCGQSHVQEGRGTTVTTVDAYAPPKVDLIQFDLEGHELFGLKGARETIIKWKPVIIVELLGLGKRYGYADSEVREFLASLGYDAGKWLDRPTNTMDWCFLPRGP